MSLNDTKPEDWDKAYLVKPEEQKNFRANVGLQPLERQVGGDHYKNLKIQPLEYAMANDLNVCEANIVKYVTRHHAKGGAEDIRKVIHYAELLLQMTYGVSE